MVTRPKAIDVMEAERLLAGRAASIPPLTLAAGDDDFLRERVVRAFRVGAAAERADFVRLEGDEAGPEEFARGFASISLFGSERRIWIREGSKLARACEEALLAWADGSAEGVRVLITSTRDVADLKVLQSIAAKGALVTCVAGAGERRRWSERLVADAGLKLPGAAIEELCARPASLLALRQEIEKLRLHADREGRVPASALGALGDARDAASVERWAAAVIFGDRIRARAEAAALDAERVGGTAGLWAVAERALAALDPQPYGPYRRQAVPGFPLRPATARRVLDAVYRADRALKRGEARDADLRDLVEQALGGVNREEI